MDGSIETPLFMAESGEKNRKIIMEKKRRKKWKFSPYSVPLFLHIIGSIETPLFSDSVMSTPVKMTVIYSTLNNQVLFYLSYKTGWQYYLPMPVHLGWQIQPSWSWTSPAWVLVWRCCDPVYLPCWLQTKVNMKSLAPKRSGCT